MYIYSNLKYIRQKMGMSQNQFAKYIGVNVSSVSRWETNINGITIDTAYMIADKLEIPLSDLISKDLKVVDKIELEGGITLENVIMEKSKNLSEDDKKKILDIIEIYNK